MSTKTVFTWRDTLLIDGGAGERLSGRVEVHRAALAGHLHAAHTGATVRASWREAGSAEVTSGTKK